MKGKTKQGMPIDENTLYNLMNEQERNFWEDFLGEAQKVISEKNKKGESKPFEPPESLKTKYQEAITKYNGNKYCQIKQLQGIFAF